MSETLSAARRRVARYLVESRVEDNIDAASETARTLVEHSVCLTRAEAAATPERVLTAVESARLESLLQRRLSREPLAHILGHKPFWTLDLLVTPDVLTPRADTETVVEAALGMIADRAAPLRIVDFGTGSGAILLALLSELPNARGLGVDASEPALAVARANTEEHGLSARCEFRLGDWAAGLADESFDLAVSNPPYISTKTLAGLAPEVRDHEPHLALDGGADGLDTYRILIPQIFRVLKPGAATALEIGFDQAAVVKALMGQAGFSGISVVRDLCGNDRAICARKPV